VKIFFHRDFLEHYAFDPAAEQGRLEPALAALEGKYPIREPRSATKEEILHVHTTGHWNSVTQDDLLCHTALLAAGSSIEAAETASSGEFAFALCRPPGHHASADSSWGFCYFNNIAVALKHIFQLGHISKALIVDFDLHFGDGTANIFQNDNTVTFWHSQENSRLRYLNALEKDLQDYEAEMVAVSAGFDRGINDWGGILTSQDYNTIGQLLGSFAREKCKGHLFAALEGGYNATALAGNIEAFLAGLQSS